MTASKKRTGGIGARRRDKIGTATVTMHPDATEAVAVRDPLEIFQLEDS